MTVSSFLMDPSVLKLNETTPVKVTFLNATSDGHFLGFYTFDNTSFADIRTVFGHVDTHSLIPNVSSVFLSNNRLTGKTPVFFLIKNGFHLNKHFSWFSDAMAGRNGTFKFLASCAKQDAVLRRQEGLLVWVDSQGEVVEPATEAQLGTPHPVLIFQTNDGKFGVVQGEILHSYGYGFYNDLNPKEGRFATMALEEEHSNVVLNFIESSEQPALLSLRLHIGEKNFTALTHNRILPTVFPLPETSEQILSAEIEISEEFEDTLYMEGVQDKERLPFAGTTFVIEANENCLKITGEAPLSVYEALLGRVKIKTDSRAVSKIEVKTLLKTAKETFVRTGNAEILSQEASSSSLMAGITLPAPEKKEPVSTIFKEVFTRPSEAVKDELPSFLTEMPSLSSTSSSLFSKTMTPRTALITGGASQQAKIVAHTLASKGYNIILHCHNSVAQTTHLVEELQATYHIKASYIRADFCSYEETVNLIPSLTQAFGQIDLLVSTATSCQQEETPVAWQTNFDVNVRAVFLLLQSYVQNLAKSQTGEALVLFEERPTEEFSSYSLSTATLKELIAKASASFMQKCHINALSISKPLEGTSQDDFEKMVSLFAENKHLSGQIIRMDNAFRFDKKR